MQRSIIYRHVELTVGERQPVHFSLKARTHLREEIEVMTRRPQSVPVIHQQVDRYRVVSTQGQAVTHPTIPCPDVQHVQPPTISSLQFRQDFALEEAETPA